MNRDYYQKNKEQILAKNKAWKLANPKKVRPCHSFIHNNYPTVTNDFISVLCETESPKDVKCMLRSIGVRVGEDK